MTLPSALEAPTATGPGPMRGTHNVAQVVDPGRMPWRWAGPIWPLLVLLSFVTVEIRFIANSTWRPVFLYDGDSLTFPILWRALAHGEPFHPVLSSQLLLFPEGLVYAVAHLCTTSVSASLVAVAYVNIVLFYLGLRALAAVVVAGSAHRRRLAALVPTLLLITAMLLERTMGVDETTVATPMLFDTFYAGVILMAVVALVLATRQLCWTADRSLAHRVAVSGAGACLLGLTIISNPLFIIQVSGPFLLVATGLWALRRIRRSQLGWLVAPHLGALLLYEALHPLYQRYIGAATGGYVHFAWAGAAFHVLRRDLDSLLASTAGCWELALITGAWVVAPVTMAVLVVRSVGRPDRRTPEATGRLLVVAFATVASVSIVPVIILVGQAEPRYLLPLVTFPLVALVASAHPRRARPLPCARLLVATLATAVGVLGLTAVPGAAGILHPEATAVTVKYGTPLGESCLEQAFGHRPANGVAAYWTARTLDLYNPDRERILQVELNETIFPWLVNLGAYEHRRFTFVLVDKFDHGMWTMRPNDVASLGPPARIVSCPGFNIYSYPPGTVGYQHLNATVDRSLRTNLARFS